MHCSAHPIRYYNSFVPPSPTYFQNFSGPTLPHPPHTFKGIALKDFHTNNLILPAHKQKLCRCTLAIHWNRKTRRRYYPKFVLGFVCCIYLMFLMKINYYQYNLTRKPYQSLQWFLCNLTLLHLRTPL